MTATSETCLHHVVFAVAPERSAAMAQLFTELGFTLQNIDLPHLGLRVHLDWDRGIELMSPVTGSTAEVAAHVWKFLERNGDGVYTVVLRVPGASAAEDIANRYGADVRFRQHIEGEGTYVTEVDLDVLHLPLTFLATNVP